MPPAGQDESDADREVERVEEAQLPNEQVLDDDPADQQASRGQREEIGAIRSTPRRHRDHRERSTDDHGKRDTPEDGTFERDSLIEFGTQRDHADDECNRASVRRQRDRSRRDGEAPATRGPVPSSARDRGVAEVRPGANLRGVGDLVVHD